MHHETLGQDKGYHEWRVMNLGQLRTIKALIKYRSQVDPFYLLKQINEGHLGTNGSPTFHEIIVNMYVDLDTLIKNTSLTNQHRELLKLLMLGLIESDIAERWDCAEENIIKMLNVVSERLKLQYERQWKDYAETSGYMKTMSEFKRCSKCKEFKRTTDKEFQRAFKYSGELVTVVRVYKHIDNVDFSLDRTNNRYKSACKSCVSNAKNKKDTNG